MGDIIQLRDYESIKKRKAIERSMAKIQKAIKQCEEMLGEIGDNNDVSSSNSTRKRNLPSKPVAATNNQKD
jgi:hypothetical protein